MARRKPPVQTPAGISAQPGDTPAAIPEPAEIPDTQPLVGTGDKVCAECNCKLFFYDLGQRCTCNNSQCGQYLVKMAVVGGDHD